MDSYPFQFITKLKENIEGCEFVCLYKFTSLKSRLCYYVRIEKYRYQVYGVKFYLKNDKNNKNRYKVYTKTYEPRRIILTCINVMLEVYKKDQYASFGFIGTNDLKEKSKCNTKRFRFYSKIMATFISDEKFLHKQNIGNSTYLLINKESLKCNINLIQEIESFFVQNYNNFD